MPNMEPNVREDSIGMDSCEASISASLERLQIHEEFLEQRIEDDVVENERTSTLNKCMQDFKRRKSDLAVVTECLNITKRIKEEFETLKRVHLANQQAGAKSRPLLEEKAVQCEYNDIVEVLSKNNTIGSASNPISIDTLEELQRNKEIPPESRDIEVSSNINDTVAASQASFSRPTTESQVNVAHLKNSSAGSKSKDRSRNVKAVSEVEKCLAPRSSRRSFQREEIERTKGPIRMRTLSIKTAESNPMALKRLQSNSAIGTTASSLLRSALFKARMERFEPLSQTSSDTQGLQPSLSTDRKTKNSSKTKSKQAK